MKVKKMIKVLIAGLAMVFGGMMIGCDVDTDVDANRDVDINTEHQCGPGYFWCPDTGSCCPDDGGCGGDCGDPCNNCK